MARKMLIFICHFGLIQLHSVIGTMSDTINTNMATAFDPKLEMVHSQSSTTQSPILGSGGKPYTIKMAVDEVKAQAAENNVEKQNGTKVNNIFILTAWRSGSSFIGEALSAHPQIYYHFEPLMYFDYEEFSAGNNLEDALQTMYQLTQCRYGKVTRYMNKIKKDWNLLTLNNKINEQCKKLGNNCFDPQFLNPSCDLFPYQLFKNVRLRGGAGEELLKRIPNSKIIYLVRDPRATFNSRMQVSWCSRSTPCGNMKNMCEKLAQDLPVMKKLQQKYPTKVMMVKYEHVALNLGPNFDKMLKFIDLQWHQNIDNYLSTHTNNHTDDPMSTYKESKTRVDRWKFILSQKDIQEVENYCAQFMMELEYSPLQKISVNSTF